MQNWDQIAFSFLLVLQMQGASVCWTGSGDGISWNDSKNWDTKMIPQSTDMVIISFGSVRISTNDNAIVMSLIIESGADHHIEQDGMLQLVSQVFMAITLEGEFKAGSSQNLKRFYTRFKIALEGDFGFDPTKKTQIEEN